MVMLPKLKYTEVLLICIAFASKTSSLLSKPGENWNCAILMKGKALLSVSFIKPVRVCIIISSGFTEPVLMLYITETHQFNPRNTF